MTFAALTEMPRNTINFDTLRKIGLTLPGAEESTAYRSPVLKVNGELHAPPRCILRWGEAGKLFSFGTNVSPWCVLESVTEEFNLFSPSGVPLRAKLNVSFREAWTVEEQLRETPRHSADRTKIHEVKRGETLSHVAAIQYNDPGEWRPIAEANELDNPRRLPPGSELRIPKIAARTR